MIGIYVGMLFVGFFMGLGVAYVGWGRWAHDLEELVEAAWGEPAEKVVGKYHRGEPLD